MCCKYSFSSTKKNRTAPVGGNPAVPEGPVAFRPHLAMSLAMSLFCSIYELSRLVTSNKRSII